MKTVVLQLPDSVQLSEEQLQELLLQKLAETNSALPPVAGSTVVQVPAQDAAEIRHLIGLYYAEKAAAAMDALWEENGWSAETMHRWLQEHLRTAYRRQDSAA